MQALIIGLLFSSLVLTSACRSDEIEDAPEPSAARRLIPQLPPPVDLKTPPADALKTGSGVVYKKLISRDAGAKTQRSGTALIHYTGWRQRAGDTFFTTKGRGRPIALDVTNAAPAFAEVLPLLRKGETVVVWVPSGGSAPETLVYEVEVVDIVSARQPAG